MLGGIDIHKMQAMAVAHGYRQYHPPGGRLKLGSLDGWTSRYGGRMRGTMSVHSGCFPDCGNAFLECRRGRNGYGVRVRRRGAMQPVIVGCNTFPPDALFLGFDSSTQLVSPPFN